MAESIEFWVDETQVIVVKEDGKVAGFSRGKILPGARFFVKESADLGSSADMHLLSQEVEEELKGKPGWIMECSIPWEDLTGKAVGEGGIIRFAVGINDCDDPKGKRECQIYYPLGWKHSNPLSFAEMYLVFR